MCGGGFGEAAGRGGEKGSDFRKLLGKLLVWTPKTMSTDMTVEVTGARKTQFLGHVRSWLGDMEASSSTDDELLAYVFPVRPAPCSIYPPECSPTPLAPTPPKYLLR